MALLGLALMKSGVILANTSRGRLIHTQALIKALKSGQVGGVAICTRAEEHTEVYSKLHQDFSLPDDLTYRLDSVDLTVATNHNRWVGVTFTVKNDADKNTILYWQYIDVQIWEKDDRYAFSTSAILIATRF
jgi:hypothetical protein